MHGGQDERTDEDNRRLEFTSGSEQCTNQFLTFTHLIEERGECMIRSERFNRTYFEVRLDALMLKKRAFASDATALA